MRTERTPANWTIGAVLALTVIFYVWPLALDIPLLDPDEGLHAAIAQEMLARGDFVTPRFLGEPFLDKPILYFWALLASLRVAGETEFAVRLPGLLFGWLGALTTSMLAYGLAGKRVAWLAFCFYATSILPLALNQAAVHDVALIPWTNLALLFLWRAERRGTTGATLTEAAVAGLFVGLAMLTKGLAGVALVGLPFAVWLVWQRRLTVRMCAAGLATLVVGAALAAPWYLAMERGQPGYLHYFFIDRHLLGFMTTTQIHGDRPWWYYVPIVAGGAWPWVVYAPFAVRRSSDTARPTWTSLVWIWIVVDLVLLSTAKSKLVTYVLPVFPAIAMLAGVAWTSVADRARDDPRSPHGFTAAIWVHAIAGSILVPVALVLARGEFGVDFGRAAWIGAVALVGGYVWVLAEWYEFRAGFSTAVGSALRRTKGRLTPAPTGGETGALAARVLVIQVGLVTAMFVLVMTVAFRPVAEQFSARSVARHFNERGALPPQIWIVDERVGSLVFYLDGSLRRGLTPAQIENVPLGLVLGRLPTAPPEVAVVLAERDVRRFARGIDLTGVPYEPAGRHRIYATGPLRERMLKIIGGVR